MIKQRVKYKTKMNWSLKSEDDNQETDTIMYLGFNIVDETEI